MPVLRTVEAPEARLGAAIGLHRFDMRDAPPPRDGGVWTPCLCLYYQ